jgi:hypothetical protein
VSFSSPDDLDGRLKQPHQTPSYYEFTMSYGHVGMDVSDKSKSQGQAQFEDLDPHRAPPQELRDLFKRYSRSIVSPEDLARVSDSSSLRESEWILQKTVDEKLVQTLFREFQEQDPVRGITLSDKIRNQMRSASVFESGIIPGRSISFNKV